MEKVFFTKMSGAGNDFIFVDTSLNPDIIPTPSIVKKLCDRRNGIGADGLMLILPSSKYEKISSKTASMRWKAPARRLDRDGHV